MMTSNSSSRTPSGSRLNFHPLMIFAVVWALATIIHLLSFPFWARTWQGWLVVLMFGLVLLQPRSLSRFTVFLIASLLNLFRAMPFVPNHVLFEGMVNLTILIAISWSVLRVTTLAMLWGELSKLISKRSLELAAFAGYVALMQTYENEYVCGSATGLILIWFHFAKLGEETSTDSRQKLYESFAPILRWEMAIMYFWAAIQKMNWDYFNPQVSSAVHLHTEIAAILPFVPDHEFVHPLAIWGSLICELGIPILLLITATRWWGILAALAFHLFLSIHPHPGIYSYSALVYGLIVVFFPMEMLQKLQSNWEHQFERLRNLTFTSLRKEYLVFAINGLFFATVILFGINYILMGETKETFLLNSRIGFFLWYLLACWLGASYWKAGWQIEENRWSIPMALPGTPAVIGLLLVIGNGLNPWLGLKTQTSFSMFSNLRTEFASNHLFLKRVDLFDYQQDMVEVVAAEPDILTPTEKPNGIEQFANPGHILPFVELRRLLDRVEGDVKIAVVRNGQQELIERSGKEVSHPEAFKPLTVAENKLLWFRRHEAWAGPMPCTH